MMTFLRSKHEKPQTQSAINTPVFLKAFAGVCIAANLYGCANSTAIPDTFYYVLEATPSLDSSPKQSASSNEQHISNSGVAKYFSVSPVKLPLYMNQANLVLKLSDHKIKVSNYHYWAEDIGTSSQNIIIKELRQLMPQIGVYSRCQDCINIDIEIEHFYPSEQGEVYLSGSFTLKTGNRISAHSFSFKQALENGGFEESVSVMRELLSSLAREIGNKIK